MTQYNSLNVKLSNLQLHKLKSAIETETEILLRLSSNIIDNSNDETNFLHKFSLTNRQVASIVKLLQIVYQLILSCQRLNYLR